MGGRGTYSTGKNVGYTYKSIGKIAGVKILVPIDSTKQLKLPEESHSSKAYVKLDKDGVFDQYREYNENHELVLEIGYHFENNIHKNSQDQPILHIHEYSPPGNFKNRPGRLLTINEFKKYHKFFINISRKELTRQLRIIKEKKL